jgi:hypothetical protein
MGERETPLGAIPRTCSRCGKRFLAMSDRQWENVRRIHELTSKRHNPPMSESHAGEMDNDLWNRAAPGHTGSPRY